MPDQKYRINGREILTPTELRWSPRQVVDIQGDNRPIYSPVRNVELRWQLDFFNEYAMLLATFDEMQSSGTAVVQIPAFPDYNTWPAATGTTYGFREYSGCTLGEPSAGAYFEGFPSEVALIIGNIVTR